MNTIVTNAAPQSRSLFRSVFTRHALYISLLMVLPIALSQGLNWTLSLLADPDLWWHLADARLLFSTGHFIQSEPYAFTVAGQRWVNPEWLSELPFWFSFKVIGLRGVYLVTWLVVCANVLLVYLRSFRAARNADAAFWAAGLGFVLMSVNVGPRMIAFGWAALSLELLILESVGEAAGHEDKRLVWFLPALFCLWINFHGSWLIGMALFVLSIAAGSLRVRMGALEQEPFTPGDRNRLLAALALSVAALFINPYGWRLVWNPIDMMLNQKLNLASVSEWQPLKLGTPGGVTLLLALALIVLANLKRSRKWSVYELAIVFFAFYAAVDHVRFLFLAAVLISPILASDLARSFSSESEADSNTIPAMNALIAAAALVYVGVMFPSEAKLQKKLETTFPLQTIRSIQPAWRTFNWDYLGGMMAFESRPSFIDSRLDTFEHHGVLQDYLGAMNQVGPLQVLDRYKIDHVFVLQEQPIAYLLERTPGWTIARREQTTGGEFVLLSRAAAASSSNSQASPVHP
jgi:hypothetical protein